MSKVNHPKHYQGCSEMGLRILANAKFPYMDITDEECIHVIEILELDFSLGNCFKYLWRLGRKKNFLFFDNTKEDLEKAKWYVNRYIENNHQKNRTVNDWVYQIKNVISDEVLKQNLGIKVTETRIF